jgi:hypothetical protein
VGPQSVLPVVEQKKDVGKSGAAEHPRSILYKTDDSLTDHVR